MFPLIVGPGGVQPPIVSVLDAYTIDVLWKPPIQPNGHLTSYIVALPMPRFTIYNMSQTTLQVEDLVPYTEYSITLTACTGKFELLF